MTFLNQQLMGAPNSIMRVGGYFSKLNSTVTRVWERARWFVLNHLRLIVLLTLMIYICSVLLGDFIFPTLHCEPLNFNVDYSHKPGGFEAWLNSLAEGELENLKEWCNQFEMDFDDEVFDLYLQHRFEVFWEGLTPEQQQEYINHNNQKTRLWGTILIVALVVLAIFLED